ncbi:MAG: hypothetical protein MUP85_03430 [Candidatus Lokiarchaeota archaeon]|nr:hypothetical protein [Candidatus Lokiarchaeota archaeon]
MEIIKNSINNDEFVKWESFQIVNYRREFIRSLIITTFLIGLLMTLIGLFFWHVPSWEGTFYFAYTNIEIPPLIIYFIIISIFYSFIAIVLVYTFVLITRGFRKVHLKLSDIRSYSLIHVLTNKRWIQKDLKSVVNFNENSLPSDVFSRINDMAFISLDCIEKVSINKLRFRFGYIFIFHFKNTSDSVQYPIFTVRFKSGNYQELIPLMVDEFPVEFLGK